MSNFAEWRAEATDERVPVEIVLDRALLSQLLAAIDELSDARKTAVGLMSDPPAVSQLAERVIELDRQVKQKTRTLWFTKIPHSQWSDLESAHKASDEVRERQRKQLEDAREVEPKAQMDTSVDWESFSVAAVAACCAEPKLTVEDAQWLRDHLPEAEWQRVWQTCASVHTQGSSIPKYVSGIVEKLASELNSTMPPDTESPSASSAAGSSDRASRNGSKATGRPRSRGSRSRT